VKRSRPQSGAGRAPRRFETWGRFLRERALTAEGRQPLSEVFPHVTPNGGIGGRSPSAAVVASGPRGAAFGTGWAW